MKQRFLNWCKTSAGLRAAAEKTRKARFEGKSTWDNMKEQAEAGVGCVLELEKYRQLARRGKLNAE